jgi:hypothetical protein
MQIEILALRHQLTVLQRQTNKRLRLRTADRLLWVSFAGLVAVAHSAGHRQTGSSNRMAAKRVSMVLALEEQSREVRST